MGYLHVEIKSAQISKKFAPVSGDTFLVERNKTSTIIVLADGLGSGIKANIAANICCSRMIQLIKSGFSVREAFSKIVRTMEDAKKNEEPYAVFSVVRILNNGTTTVLSYEMPQPILVSQSYSTPLKQRVYTIDTSVIGETSCFLNPNEGIVVVTDGITYAGIGGCSKNGWTIEGVSDFINYVIQIEKDSKNFYRKILAEAKLRWNNLPKDDLSVIFAQCRKGRVVNILTGPPMDKQNDSIVVNEFMNSEGIKIICGATTAKIVSREIDEKLSIDDTFQSIITPPKYYLDSINLVTEGAVTLNQLFNIWGEDESKIEKNNPVGDLSALISVADRINLFIGTAENVAENDFAFRQTGILNRMKILPLLIEKWKKEEKLVVEKYF